MKILVTGGNGFVGSYLIKELILRGHVVTSLDSVSNGSNTVVDIMDKTLLSNTLKKLSPDFVIHLAAISSVDHSDLSQIYNTNFIGTLNLLESCSELATKPRFMFVSSSQVYGNPADKRLIDESFLLNPVNHYGASKAAGEMAVKGFCVESGIEYIIVRPFNHTGRGQTERFVVPKIAAAFRDKNESIELGNIDTIRDFTDVRDVVKAYSGLLEHFQSGEVYNIASSRGICIADIIEMLKKITNQNIEVIKKNLLVRSNEISVTIGDIKKLTDATGWKPEISIEETLKNMLYYN